MTVSDLQWVSSNTTGKLAVAARPRAGEWLEDEILAWKNAGVQTVVCLLEDAELSELDLSKEPSLCQTHGLEFVRLPIPDRGLPSMHAASALSEKLAQSMILGRNILVHCRMGIGRTGIMGAAILIKAGIEPKDAICLISEARGLTIPDTDEQKAWIFNFG
jgi:protein-tyrosine phosphatase